MLAEPGYDIDNELSDESHDEPPAALNEATFSADDRALEEAFQEPAAYVSARERADDLMIVEHFDEDDAEGDPAGLRGLQWIRKNMSSLRVTVSLQRKPTPASRKPQ